MVLALCRRLKVSYIYICLQYLLLFSDICIYSSVNIGVGIANVAGAATDWPTSGGYRNPNKGFTCVFPMHKTIIKL